jgi:hypothetical protein
MPDFEALIRRQQDNQSTPAQRLSLVEPTTASEAVGAPLGWLAFGGSLLGALLGTVGVQVAASMGWFSF